MADILRFNLTRAVAPWNHTTSKGQHLSTRIAFKCVSSEYIPPQEDAPPVSTEIFVYLWNGERYIFNHVAIPTELTMLPSVSAVEPGTEASNQWVRQDSIDMLLPSFEIAEEFSDKVESDIYFLAREIGNYKKLIGPLDLTIEARIEDDDGTESSSD